MGYYVEERSGRERSSLLDMMFRQRYEVFVRRLRWDLPAAEGRETDQFDRLDARYLLLLNDASNGVHGSLRLLPSNGPHVLSEIFPALCEYGVPKGDHIWEVSRMCVCPKLRPKVVREYVIDLMAVNVVETALLNDVQELTFVVGSTLMQRVISMGWDIQPLGLSQPCGRELVTAFRVSLKPDTLRILGEQCEESRFACVQSELDPATVIGAA